MLSGRYRLAERKSLILAVSPSKPVLKIEYITMYGFASGATARTSVRMLRSLPMAIRVHARVEEQADVVAVREDAVDEVPAELAELFFPLGIPEEVLAVFAN